MRFVPVATLRFVFRIFFLSLLWFDVTDRWFILAVELLRVNRCFERSQVVANQVRSERCPSCRLEISPEVFAASKLRFACVGCGEVVRVCKWCKKVLQSVVRADALFCDTRCRQAFHRFARGRGLRPAAKGPLRVAYADPPYPNRARLYRRHRDFGGEVAICPLICRLVNEFPDGWALSTSSESLGAVLRFCPASVRVAAWFRGERPTASFHPLSAWEPVVYYGGRARKVDAERRRVDALVHFARPRRTDAERCLGAKPAVFCYWLFDLLGLLPGDDLVDMFPGSGGVGLAFKLFGRG